MKNICWIPIIGWLAYGQAAPVADQRAVIVCSGDSLTAGFGVDPAQSDPDDLMGALMPLLRKPVSEPRPGNPVGRERL